MSGVIYCLWFSLVVFNVVFIVVIVSSSIIREFVSNVKFWALFRFKNDKC